MIIKLPNRKNIFRLLIISSFSIVSLTLVSSSTGPEPARTGAPGESTCSNCHINGLGTNTIALDFGDSSYLGGKIYDLTITASNPSAKNFGFQMTALDENHEKTGTFIKSDNNTVITSEPNSGRQYVSHNTAPLVTTGSRQWTVKWQAPPVSMGDVTFYIAMNGGNADGTFKNDRITKTTKIFKSAFGVGVLDAAAISSDITVYPNPAAGSATIGYFLGEQTAVDISLYDLNGKKSGTLLQTVQHAGRQSVSIDLDGKYAPGIYLLKIEAGRRQHFRKFIIQ
jgi:hypothetical protein